MQYRGVFGISYSVTGIREGEMHNVFVKGASILVIGCKDHVFWIVGVKMERTYYASEALRFDQSQLEDSLAFLMNKYVCAGVQFKEVYKRTIRCNQLPLAEGMFERWNCGRVACIGDSVHKVRLFGLFDMTSIGPSANPILDDSKSWPGRMLCYRRCRNPGQCNNRNCGNPRKTAASKYRKQIELLGNCEQA